jgi:hypothetical protein
MFRMSYGTSHIDHTYNSINTQNMTHVKCPHKHLQTLTLHTATYSKHPTSLIQTKLHKTFIFLNLLLWYYSQFHDLTTSTMLPHC